MQRLLGPAIALALAGCAVAPPPSAPAPPPPVADLAPARPRLFYVGLGMGGETWSEDDMAAMAERLRAVAPDFEVVPSVFSNPVPGEPARFPAVEGRAVKAAASDIADQAGPRDLVLVYVSTHGAPGLFGQAAAGRQLRPVGAKEFRRWMAPLEGHDTVLILSACFSGSFIPALREKHRVIFTAARADRTSFGCQPGASHTVFGSALLDSLAPHESLHELVDRTRAAVRARETEMKFQPPSMPQIAVGSAMRTLYDAPVF